jgi:hypothetical protein
MIEHLVPAELPCLEAMPSALACVLTLNGKHYPFVVLLLLGAIMLYQLVSGSLLNLYWGVWFIRKDRPRAFWSVLAIEFAVVLIVFYLGTV